MFDFTQHELKSSPEVLEKLIPDHLKSEMGEHLDNVGGGKTKAR